MQAVKFKDGNRDIIEGLLAPYYGPDFLAKKDFDGEYFTPDTNFELEWFGDWQRPVLFGHGTDEALKTAVIGRMRITPTDAGLWAEAKLEEANAYKDAISKLVDEGALGWSAGSVERFYAAGVEPDGHIKHFPIIEGSLVTMPANPLAAGAHYAAKSTDITAHLAVLGVALPDAVKDVEPPEDDPNEDHKPIELPRPDPLDATTALILNAAKAALTPQALHDAAVESGAKCASEMHDEPPEPALAVRNDSVKNVEAIDLDALRSELRALAVDVVNQELR